MCFLFALNMRKSILFKQFCFRSKGLFTWSFSCSSGFARSFIRFFVRSFSPVSVQWTFQLSVCSSGFSFARSFAFLVCSACSSVCLVLLAFHVHKHVISNSIFNQLKVVLKHYKCPTLIVLQPCHWLFELDFRLCGCTGIRLWGLFILVSNRKVIWLFIKLVTHWSLLFWPCVHSSFCLSICYCYMLPYSSVIFTVSTCETVCTVFSWA